MKCELLLMLHCNIFYTFDNIPVLHTNLHTILSYSNTIDIICIIIKKSQYLSRALKNTFFMRTNKTNKKNNKPSMNICAKQHAIM